MMLHSPSHVPIRQTVFARLQTMNLEFEESWKGKDNDLDHCSTTILCCLGYLTQPSQFGVQQLEEHA